MDLPPPCDVNGKASARSGFVICHHPTDEDWAAFLDWHLRALGYATQLDAFDVAAGDNVVLARHLAIGRLGGALLVVSQAFLADPRDDVWSAASASGYRVVPVVVDDATVPGLLAALGSIRLHGLSEAECVSRLRQRLAPQRPDQAPTLPAAVGTHTSLQVARPGPWRHLLERAAPAVHAFLTRIGLLSEPPELAELRAYLASLRSGLVQDLRERNYVPMDARDVPQPSSLPVPGDDPFVRPVQQLIRQVMGTARGGDGATAQISAVSRRSKLVRNIARSLVSSDEPLVLLGDPGSGKTMTLQHAVLNVIDVQLRRVYPVVPVFVRLGDFHVGTGRPAENDVQAHLLKGLDSRVVARYDALHRAGRLMVFFDGMDEMSRERYGAHVEVLSRFAASRHPLTRSLFSCRINDFSPEFMHRRLVLLPFERDQVREFLSLYVPAWPLRISGENYSLKTLTDRLWSGGQPVDVRNPFVLWLLRYYLLATHEWPSSRPGLLAFYCRRVYRRKRDDQSGEPAFARLRRPFTDLGRLAFCLMDRNLGTSASLVDLRPALPGVDVDALAQVGVRCGLLGSTWGSGSMRLRFAHHRLQEFFAARHIRRSGVDVHWDTALEAPRWQETLVNYVLMRGRSEPVEQLNAAIVQLIGKVERRAQVRRAREEYEELGGVDGAGSAADEVPGADEDALEWPATGPLITDDEQTFAADRVELLSRLIRQDAGLASEAQAQTFGRAVATLVKHGNPSTQVKMLWACENVPEAEVGDALTRLLNSPIGWVRNQALMLLASPAARVAGIGTDLTAQIGFDLARGEMLRRFAGHAKAAKASKAPRRWWNLAMGLLCMALLAAALAGLAGLIYWAGVTWLPPRDGTQAVDNIRTFLPPMRFAALVGGMALLGLILQPSMLWLFVLLTAVAALPIVGYAPWFWSAPLPQFIGLLITLPIGLLIASVALSVPAAAIHLVVVAIFMLCTTPLAQIRTAVRSAANVSVEHCGYVLVLPILRFAPYFALAIGGLAGLQWAGPRLLAIVQPRLAAFWSWLQLPETPIGWLGLCAVSLLALVACGLAIRHLRRNYRDQWQSAVVFVGIVARIAGIGAVIWGLVALVKFVSPFVLALFTPLVEWLNRVAPGQYIVRTLLVLLGVGGLLLLALSLRSALRSGFALVAMWRAPYAPNELTPPVWRDMLARADPTTQDLILRRSSQQALGLDAPAFLQMLRELHDTVKHEPALGTYWRMRHELEQVIRQDEQGHIGGV